MEIKVILTDVFICCPHFCCATLNYFNSFGNIKTTVSIFLQHVFFFFNTQLIEDKIIKSPLLR